MLSYKGAAWPAAHCRELPRSWERARDCVKLLQEWFWTKNEVALLFDLLAHDDFDYDVHAQVQHVLSFHEDYVLILLT